MCSDQVPEQMSSDHTLRSSEFLYNQFAKIVIDIYEGIQPDRFDAFSEHHFMFLSLNVFMTIGVGILSIVCSLGRQDIVHRILLAIINSKNSEVIDKWKLLGQYCLEYAQDINHSAYPESTWLIGMNRAARDSTLPSCPSSNLSHAIPADNNNNLSCVIVGDVSYNSEDDVYFSCRSDLSKSPPHSVEETAVKNQMPEQKRTSDARTIEVKDKITPNQSKRLCKAVTDNRLCNKSRGILSSLRNRLSCCVKCLPGA